MLKLNKGNEKNATREALAKKQSTYPQSKEKEQLNITHLRNVILLIRLSRRSCVRRMRNFLLKREGWNEQGDCI